MQYNTLQHKSNTVQHNTAMKHDKHTNSTAAEKKEV